MLVTIHVFIFLSCLFYCLFSYFTNIIQTPWCLWPEDGSCVYKSLMCTVWERSWEITVIVGQLETVYSAYVDIMERIPQKMHEIEGDEGGTLWPATRQARTFLFFPVFYSKLHIPTMANDGILCLTQVYVIAWRIYIFVYHYHYEVFSLSLRLQIWTFFMWISTMSNLNHHL